MLDVGGSISHYFFYHFYHPFRHFPHIFVQHFRNFEWKLHKITHLAISGIVLEVGGRIFSLFLTIFSYFSPFFSYFCHSFSKNLVIKCKNNPLGHQRDRARRRRQNLSQFLIIFTSFCVIFLTFLTNIYEISS